MEIHLSESCPFNLDFTLCCGQTFRWKERSGWWYGVVENTVLRVRQLGDRLEMNKVEHFDIKDFFGLHDDLPSIYNRTGRDRHIKEAFETFRGLRILRQNPWECLISYICASYKNIPAIKKMVDALCRKFGNRIQFFGQIFYTFPSVERLTKTTIPELLECGLGYRAKYVHETARIVKEEGYELTRLRKASYEKAKEELLNFPGVGLKVADCVLLFSLEKLQAFPIDVWIKKAVLRNYTHHFSNETVNRIQKKRTLNKQEYNKLNSFGRNYFGKFAGYAQEYLYHYERESNFNRSKINSN